MTKNYIFTALIVLCLGAGNTGCSNKSDVIVAQVGKEKITLKEFNKSLDDATQVYGDYLNSESGKKQLLDSIIKEKLVLDAAKKAGIKNRPEIKKKLALLNEKIAETQKKYESEILIEEILKEKSSLKPNEIKEYYDKNRDEFEKPIEIRVSHILLNTKDEASRIYERIKKGENFAQLARDFSIDKNTAKEGGDIGYFGKRQFVPSFEETAFGLK